MPHVDLREAMAQVNEAIGRLGTHEDELISAQMTTLRASWADLVQLMAIEPAQPTRECPSCGHRGLRIAIRCGFCWRKLLPMA
jgi:hypothetical protein